MIGLASSTDSRTGSIKEPKPIGIERLLEWTFCAQKAQLEPQDEAMVWASGGRSMEYALMQRARLGCKIDGSGPGLYGGTPIHQDAEAVAAVCKGILDWRTAQMVVSYASAGTRPSWMPGAEPKVQPAAWHENQHGRRGVMEQAIPGAKYPGGTWRNWMSKPTIRRCQKNGIELTRNDVEHITMIGRVTPIVWEPSRQMILSCRIEYMDWWKAMHTVREHLIAGDVLLAHRLTHEMPPATPWLDAGETSEGLPEHRKGGRTPWS